LSNESAVVVAKNFKKSTPSNTNDNHGNNQKMPNTGDANNIGMTLIGVLSVLSLFVYSFFKPYKRERQ
ncbi:LPXTG cell wall anchor domain-containing protein, partial [Lacticaseibacillus paracasei]|uniref:LPXTG cell wall anchor domain-containing protein n=1 Tax=Lacticaseibacillus paracasei TaxID=1597 RepID=UPI001E374F8F